MKIFEKIGLMGPVIVGMVMACLTSLAVAAESVDARIQQRRPANEGSKILAFETNKARDIFGVLIAEKEAKSNLETINLLVFDPNGGLLKTLPLFTSTGSSDDQLVVHSKAGLAIDDNGEAHIAMAAKSGQVKLARRSLRDAASNSLVKPVALGGGGLEITKLLISRRGELVVAGSLGGKGFMSALSKQGAVIWTRSFEDGVTVILDMVETEAGFIVVGGVPAKFASYILWLGRLSVEGEIREKQLRSETGAGRFAKLSSEGGKIALVYELHRTEVGEGKSKVLLDVFQNAASLKNQRSVEIYTGDLLAPAGLIGSEGGFKLAGVGAGGVLNVYSVAPGMEVLPISKTVVKAPDYRRVHSVEMLGAFNSLLLASIESRAEGRQQKLEFVLSKIAVK